MAECSDGAMPLGTHMTGRIHDAGGNGKNFWVPRWEPHGSSGEWPDVHICRTFEGQLGVEKHADLQIEVGKGNQLMVSIHLQMYKRITLKALNSPHLLPDLACCLNCLAGGGEEVGVSGSASNPS